MDKVGLKKRRYPRWSAGQLRRGVAVEPFVYQSDASLAELNSHGFKKYNSCGRKGDRGAMRTHRGMNLSGTVVVGDGESGAGGGSRHWARADDLGAARLSERQPWQFERATRDARRVEAAPSRNNR